MRLHLLSDLHTGHCAYGPAPVCADALVLPGDIADGASFGVATVAADYLAAGLPVLYVLGNHEFYGTRLPRALRQLQRQCRAAGITLLHNRAVVINGVRFAGATLWTDFRLYGAGAQAISEHHAKYGISDFSCIFDGQGRLLAPWLTARWHAKSLRLLDALLAESFEGPTVVVTHHGPHRRSIHPRWAGHPVNPAFASDLEAFILRHGPALWAHGHVHDSFDYRVGATRVLANPRGYVKQLLDHNGVPKLSTENAAFNPELVVSV